MKIKKILSTVLIMVFVFTAAIRVGTNTKTYASPATGDTQVYSKAYTYNQIDTRVENLTQALLMNDTSIYYSVLADIMNATGSSLLSLEMVAIKQDITRDRNFYNNVKQNMKTNGYKNVTIKQTFIYKTTKLWGEYDFGWWPTGNPIASNYK